MNSAAGRSAIVCTAADAPYFPLLEGLVESLAAGPIARGLALGVLDLGLTQPQQEWLGARGAKLVAPGWDLDFPGRERAASHYRAMTARPHLPKYFPGHETILWLDADTWVQDDAALAQFIAAAKGGKLAIVPELDRGYRMMYKPPKLWGQNQKAFAWAFGMRAGYRYGRNPILNVGAFAIEAGAPHWAHWAEAHRRALNRPRLTRNFIGKFEFFLSEQTAINYVAFAEKLPTTLLPATANWFVAKGAPLWDAARGMLVEPHAPHAPLGIVHLAGQGVKDRALTIAAVDGGSVTAHLTWGGIQELRRTPR